MAGGDTGINDMNTQSAPKKVYLLISQFTRKLGDPSRGEDIGKQHQLLLIAFNYWVLNKPQVNNASVVTTLPVAGNQSHWTAG